ncbi:MAG: hypothetical protein SWO11_22055 [Thermodesulfobacteriota bacterium]|nr:hypothetical protein [Thermodesulfobacteriota bacterium]
MNRKEDILDEQHWRFQDYRQRIEAKDWKAILLNEDDKIIFKGRATQLIAKSLGCGIYEVSKQTTN